MNKENIYLIVKWRIKSGKVTDVLALLEEMGEKTRKEKGNLLYHIHQSPEDEHILYLYESYTDTEAVEAHKASTHYQQIVAGKIIPMLAEREVKKVKAISV